MPKGNWKSLALLGGVAALGTAFLALSLYSLTSLDWVALAYCAGLLVLTLAAGQFTVSVNNVDGESQGRKSVADAFIFLAAMMYGPAPATVLAAVDGFGTTRRAKDRRVTVLTTAAAAASTHLAVTIYEVLADLLIAGDAVAGGHGAPLSVLLLP
ncbi:MAG: hypothetical protein ACRD68_02755, partial [Pyrinomonadaceae bacterium]